MTTAARALFDEHATTVVDAVHALARRLFSPGPGWDAADGEAADLAQETLLRTWRAVDADEVRAAELPQLVAYARSTMVNILTDTLRRRDVRRRRLADRSPLPHDEHPTQAAVPQSDPAVAADGLGFYGHLWRLCAGTDPLSWRIVCEHAIEGRPLCEIAGELQVKADTMRKKWQRICDRLRQMVPASSLAEMLGGLDHR